MNMDLSMTEKQRNTYYSMNMNLQFCVNIELNYVILCEQLAEYYILQNNFNVLTSEYEIMNRYTNEYKLNIMFDLEGLWTIFTSIWSLSRMSANMINHGMFLFESPGTNRTDKITLVTMDL